ncbi:hypothetical protein D9V86_10775 [Bacteroidetes/Chlorobi group bacterium ChocPot_Mid]|jgi:hypothetical protein|nr:MAG: hypothetical protein D9V86_10775 [Bacteroidetes/Chlorobi group bacterium ChocPot_Mid]
MKIKFNWGWGIAVFYSAFVLFLIGNVVFSFFQRTDLVTENYYNDELAYQQTIHKAERAKRLEGNLNIVQGASTIAIQFPEEVKGKKIEGSVLLYRPSDASADRKIRLNVNDNNFQVIDSRQLAKGLWVMKIDWFDGDSTYYNEEKITIQ